MPSNLEIMLEAERRGILPDDKKALLTEARSRGLVPQLEQQKAPPPKQSISRTALDQGLQGATFGLGDEVSDYAGAAIAKGSDLLRGDQNKLFKDQSIADLINQARNMSKERLQAQVDQNTGTSIASNLAGGLLTGGAAGATKLGGNVGRYINSGNLVSKIAKGAALGSLSGGAYGFGTADDGERLKGAGEGSVSGAVIGGALPLAGSALNSAIKGTKNTVAGIKSRNPETLRAIAEAGKKEAGDIRNKMVDIGTTLTSETSNKLSNTLDQKLKEIDLISELYPKTSAIVNRIKEVSQKGDLDLNKLDQYRRLLRSAGKEEDFYVANQIRGQIDNLVNKLEPEDISSGGVEAVDLLNKFRKQYTQSSKFDEIASLLEKADGSPNMIKSKLKTFLLNKDNLRGWKPEEIAALKEAASSSTMEKVYKMAGKFGIDLGSSLSPGNTVLPLVASYAGGATVPVVGTASRQMQKYLARGKAENLLKTLEGTKGGKEAAKKMNMLPPTIAASVLSTLFDNQQ